MKPEEMQKLLGGYATGTLTAQEQEALFAAALEDQELFDALAKEQALRDLLRDPAARAHVLASLDERRLPWWRAHRWTLAGATVACCLAMVVGIYWKSGKPEAPRPVLVAETRAPEVPPARTPDVAAQSKTQPAPPAAPRRLTHKSVPAATPSEPLAVLDKDAASAAPKSVVAGAAPKALVAEAPQDARAAAPQNAPTAVATTVPPSAPAPLFRQAAPSNPAGVPAAENTATLEAQGLANALAGGNENARSLFYGGEMSAFSAGQQVQFARTRTGNASLHLGVKWTALRRQADGLFSEVDPAEIKAGDTVKLRLVPNDGGYLSVMEGHRAVVAERRVEPLQPFETPELTSAGGSRELVVVLGRQPQLVEKGKTGAAPRIIRSADQSEHAVYEVAAGGSVFQPVTVKINLKFQ
jgi:hypothetical protein